MERILGSSCQVGRLVFGPCLTTLPLPYPFTPSDLRPGGPASRRIGRRVKGEGRDGKVGNDKETDHPT